MFDAFKDLLCSKLCWHNRPGPTFKSCTAHSKTGMSTVDSLEVLAIAKRHMHKLIDSQDTGL